MATQLLEIKNDGLMKRTMARPLPSGRAGPVHAAAFAAIMGIGGVSLLAWQVVYKNKNFFSTINTVHMRKPCKGPAELRIS
jgi:heme O synthase-like polyprenyltransferase